MEGTFILVILHVSTKQSMLLSEIDKKTIKNLNRANLYGDTEEGVHWLHEEAGFLMG